MTHETFPHALIQTFEGHSPHLADDSWVAPGVQIMGRVTLGPEANVWYNSVLRGDVDTITVGKRTNIQDLTIIHSDEGEPTTIGEEVTVGHSAIIHGCTIGDRCLIGMGARILNNAVIGDESLVAAGAVIPPGKVYPPRSLIMGSPGRVVREVTDDEVQGFILSAHHYADNAKKHAAELSKRRSNIEHCGCECHCACPCHSEH